ncbi:protein [Escherichia coli]|nr:protein [Escherichia coli]
MRYFILMFTFVCSFVAAQPTIVPQLQQQVTDLTSSLNSQEKKELTHKLESIFNNTWICPYISRHLLSLNPLQARCRRYSRGER